MCFREENTDLVHKNDRFLSTNHETPNGIGEKFVGIGELETPIAYTSIACVSLTT